MTQGKLSIAAFYTRTRSLEQLGCQAGLFFDCHFQASIVLGIEPELAVPVVSNTITDFDYCMSPGSTLQHNGMPKMR